MTLNCCSIAHNLIGGKQGVIDITTGTNPAIAKGKSGHLIVVCIIPCQFSEYDDIFYLLTTFITLLTSTETYGVLP
jgi:hypothetical protein